VPNRLRARCQKGFTLSGKRRRRDRRTQHVHAGAVGRGIERCADRAQQIAPGRYLAAIPHGLRTVGVVQREDRGLRQRIGGAQARRMKRVALDFRRAAHVAGHYQTNRAVGARHGGGEAQRHARRHVFRRTHIGHDRFRRRRGAALRAGQRHRRGHQLQETPPIAARAVPHGRQPRKFFVKSLLKLRIAGKLFEAAPELRQLARLCRGVDRR
jgi:hypothetical protein